MFSSLDSSSLLCLFLILVSSFYYFHFYSRSSVSPLSLAGRSILITGCDTGFGRISALRFARSGAKVFAGCLTQAGIESLRSEFPGPNLGLFLLDVTNDSSVAECAKMVKQQCPEGLYALINNAGIGIGAAVELCTIDDYKRVMEVNYFGVLRITKSLLRQLIAGRGRVVNLSSCAGLSSAPLMSAYAASKYALEAFSDSLRNELKPWGVSVHLMEPAFFRTQILQSDPKTSERLWNGLSDEVRAAYGQEYYDSMRDGMKDLQQIAGDPERVVDDIEHALSSSRPAVRYHPGFQSHLFWIISMLPAPLMDMMYQRVTMSDPKKIPAALKNRR